MNKGRTSSYKRSNIELTYGESYQLINQSINQSISALATLTSVANDLRLFMLVKKSNAFKNDSNQNHKSCVVI